MEEFECRYIVDNGFQVDLRPYTGSNFIKFLKLSQIGLLRNCWTLDKQFMFWGSGMKIPCWILGVMLAVLTSGIACSTAIPPAGSPTRMPAPTVEVSPFRPTLSPTLPLPYCRWPVWIPGEPAPLPDLTTWRWAPLPKAGRMLRHLPHLPLPLFPRARSADGRWIRAVAVFASTTSAQEASRFHPTLGVWIDRKGTDHRWIERPEAPWMLSPATFAFPSPGDHRLQALRFLDLINTLAPREQARIPVGEGPEPSPTPGARRILSPPVPFREVYPLTGSLVLAQETNGRLWRGNPERGQWELVRFLPEVRLETLQILGVREGEYALAIDTPDFDEYRVWRISARWGDPAFLLTAFGMREQGYASGRHRRLDDTDLWLLGWPMDRPFWADAVLIDAQAGRLLGPGDLGLGESFNERHMKLEIVPSPDGKWLWVEMVSLWKQAPDRVLDPEALRALVPVWDLGRGQRFRGLTLGGWLPGISALWVWEHASGRISLIRLPHFERIPLPEVQPPVAEAPDGGVAVAWTDPAQIVRWDARGKIQELVDLKPDYEAVIGLWSDGEVVFAMAMRGGPDGRCRFGLIEIHSR